MSEVVLECEACGGRCCTYFIVPVGDPLKYPEVAEYLERAVVHEGVVVEKVSGDWWLRIESPCVYLKDGRCSDYENRPSACRAYPELGVCDEYPEWIVPECQFRDVDAFRAWYVGTVKTKAAKAKA